MRGFLIGALVLAASGLADIGQASAAPVSVEAVMTPTQSMRMDFADGSKRFVLMVRREGKAEGEGLLRRLDNGPDPRDMLRLALEERTSFSPDALTGMEANLRFAGSETMETRIFGRLSAWQNWIFNRPNAVGDQGALKVFGAGSKPKFDWERV